MYLYIRVYAYIHSFINICIYLFIYIAPIYKRRSPCGSLTKCAWCFYTFFVCVPVHISIRFFLCISLYASLPTCFALQFSSPPYVFVIPLVFLHNFANVLKWIFCSSLFILSAFLLHYDAAHLHVSCFSVMSNLLIINPLISYVPFHIYLFSKMICLVNREKIS